MQYEVSALGRGNSFGVYDNIGNGFVCKRDLKPFTTRDPMKAARLANRLNSASDASAIASALVDFGANQSDAWRYAQGVYDLAGKKVS